MPGAAETLNLTLETWRVPASGVSDEDGLVRIHGPQIGAVPFVLVVVDISKLTQCRAW